MYSSIIRPKVEEMFSNFREQTINVLNESTNLDEIIRTITRIVTFELTMRSKFILNDMLFALTNAVLVTEFFTESKKKNAFYEIDLEQEIVKEYQFEPSVSIGFNESSRMMHAAKVGGATFAVGGVAGVGIALKTGVSLSSLLPIPLGGFIAASIGVALADYYALGPQRSKKELEKAINEYLDTLKEQFLNWFDEIEVYFNKRVEEIKLTMWGYTYEYT